MFYRAPIEHVGLAKALVLALARINGEFEQWVVLRNMLSKADWTWPVKHLQFFQADESRIECSLGSIFLSEPTQVWQNSNRVQLVSDNHSGLEQEKEWDLISFLHHIFYWKLAESDMNPNLIRNVSLNPGWPIRYHLEQFGYACFSHGSLLDEHLIME